ncbi:MAG: DUF6398 domain-containing protein [Bacteroidota bacterium]
MSKEKLKQRVAEITELATSFCAQKLDDEYLELTEKVIGKLARKRPSPLLRGKTEIWAAGVVHALGQTNFLYDKETEPHVSYSELNEFFGTKKSSVGNKAADIRSMLRIKQLTSAEYMTSKMKSWNPLMNIAFVDGMMVPIASLPEQYQKIARKIVEQGGHAQFWTNEDEE